MTGCLKHTQKGRRGQAEGKCSFLALSFQSLLHSNYDYFYDTLVFKWASLVAQVVKNLPANAGDVGSIPGSGRSPGEENGNLPQYSCLEKSMDRGAWRGVTESDTAE